MLVMDDIKMVELIPCDNRKSFYGKAHVFIHGNIHRLQSYDTIVAYWNDEKKTFVKLWGYSATTMRHINSFMRYLGFSLGGKAWWDSLEYGKEYTISELLNA